MESQRLEWKRSWRDEHLKWICGFANAQGGVLEVGRNDRGEVVGLRDTARLLEDLPERVRSVLGIVAKVDLAAEVPAGKWPQAVGRHRFPPDPGVIL